MISVLEIFWFLQPPLIKAALVVLAVDFSLIFTCSCDCYASSQAITPQDVELFFNAVTSCSDLTSSVAEPTRSYIFDRGIKIDSGNISSYCDSPEWRKFNSTYPKYTHIESNGFSKDVGDDLKSTYNLSVCQPNHILYKVATVGLSVVTLMTVFTLLKLISQ